MLAVKGHQLKQSNIMLMYLDYVSVLAYYNLLKIYSKRSNIDIWHFTVLYCPLVVNEQDINFPPQNIKKKIQWLSKRKSQRELNPDGTIRGLFAVCFEIH